MPNRNKFYALETGFNFIVPKQAAGATPTVRKAVWNPHSSVRENGGTGDGPEFGVFVQEAAAGGSNLTLTLLVVEATGVVPVTVPDTTVVTTQFDYIGILEGPAFNADGFEARHPGKFYHVYQQVAMS